VRWVRVRDRVGRSGTVGRVRGGYFSLNKKTPPFGAGLRGRVATSRPAIRGPSPPRGGCSPRVHLWGFSWWASRFGRFLRALFSKWFPGTRKSPFENRSPRCTHLWGPKPLFKKGTPFSQGWRGSPEWGVFQTFHNGVSQKRVHIGSFYRILGLGSLLPILTCTGLLEIPGLSKVGSF